MELNIQEPINKKELIKQIEELNILSQNFSIKIENNIITIDGKWLLRNDKGTLKNIQALANPEDDLTEIRSEVRKTTQDYPGRMDVDIKKFLGARLENHNPKEKKTDVILSYLSVLETGNSEDIEKWKKKGFCLKDIDQIDRTQLSPNTSYVYGIIKQNESEIRNLLKKYTNFNDKKFKQYFFYGIDNKEGLLEGIIYYTNSHLTAKYLKLRGNEKFPSAEEKMKILKCEVAKNYEQIYRFINILDKEENSRFDYQLLPEEKEELYKEIQQKLQSLEKNKLLLIFRRGIFFNDRISGAIGLTYDKQKGYEWVKEVYEVTQQLRFMERIDKHQYYKKWLTAKMERIKNNPQHPEDTEEKIKIIKECYKEKFGIDFDYNEQSKEQEK